MPRRRRREEREEDEDGRMNKLIIKEEVDLFVIKIKYKIENNTKESTPKTRPKRNWVSNKINKNKSV